MVDTHSLISLTDLSVDEMRSFSVPTNYKAEIIAGMLNSGIGEIFIGDVNEFKLLSCFFKENFRGDVIDKLKKCMLLYKISEYDKADRYCSSSNHRSVFSISVSDLFSQVNRDILCKEEETEVIKFIKNSSLALNKVHVRVETCFDCPYEGAISIANVTDCIGRWVDGGFSVDFCISDTMGNATPDRVFFLFDRLLSMYSSELVEFSFLPNNIFGLGLGNLMAAFNSGVRSFLTSLGGFSRLPNNYIHKKNLATEDVVFLFDKMSIRSNITLRSLLAVVDRLAFFCGPHQINGYIGNLPVNYVMDKVRHI